MAISNIFSFLEDLKNNNNRDWFQAHKSRYIESKQEFELMVEVLIQEIRRFDKNIPLLKASDCVFRIYRDVRFGKDKSPYKTHLGAFITPSGRKGIEGGYYIHLEPGQSILAGGIHNPPPDVLRRIRSYIFNHYDVLNGILNEKEFIKHYKGISGESLKMAPKGFPKDFKYVDLLKFKSYTVYTDINQSILEYKFPEGPINLFKIMYPFVDFLTQSVSG